MNTSIQKTHAIVSQVSSTKRTAKKNFITEFIEKSESNRFGIIPIVLLIVACIGGITAAYATDDSAFRLGLVVFPTIISLALILAVAPMKWILWLSTSALIIDILLFII